MISKSEILPGLLKACPEFKPEWDEYVYWMTKAGKSRSDDPDALMIAMFLDKFYRSRQTHFFPGFFAFVESLFVEGAPEAQITADELLKQIRMRKVTLMNGPELYASWMGAETKRHWEKVSQEVVAKNPKYATRPPRKRERLREYKVTLTKCEPGESAVPDNYRKITGAGTATKLGGEPNWLQGDERPKCPCCNRDMTFVAQIDSIEHINPVGIPKLDAETVMARRREQQWMFADVGMIYVFFCFNCLETQSVLQFH